MLFIVQSPYWFTIGRRGVLSLGGWTPHIQSQFPELEPTRGHPQIATTGLSPSVARHSNRFACILVHPRSLAATDGVALLSFPVGTEMFQFPTFAPNRLCIQRLVHFRVGCPIRRSRDRSLVTGSFWLIAGSRVLHRLSTPRHPPCALVARSRQPDAANTLRYSRRRAASRT